MSFPTIKVCGNTDLKIINLCISEGAKLIGFIVNYFESPRSISIDKLKDLVKNIPENIEKVAVMVNPTIDEIIEVSHNCNIIQLHGNETNELINKIKKKTSLKVIKAIKVIEKQDLFHAEQFPSADIILYDTPSMGQEGDAFNFDLLKDLKNKNFFLAGKIGKDNVKSALKYTNNIDVNSSLETERGIKDPKKIKEFFLTLKKI